MHRFVRHASHGRQAPARFPAGASSRSRDAAAPIAQRIPPSPQSGPGGVLGRGRRNNHPAARCQQAGKATAVGRGQPVADRYRFNYLRPLDEQAIRQVAARRKGSAERGCVCRQQVLFRTQLRASTELLLLRIYEANTEAEMNGHHSGDRQSASDGARLAGLGA